MNAKLIFLTACSIIGLSTTALAQTEPSALLVAEGSWELVPSDDPGSKELAKVHRCGVEPLNVTIDSEKKRYTARFGTQKELIKGDIVESGPSFLKIKYDNEERKMKNGKLHVWYMVFTSDDEFIWVREDWVADGEILGATPARRRCTAPIA